jgi:hypothetical protein
MSWVGAEAAELAEGFDLSFAYKSVTYFFNTSISTLSLVTSLALGYAPFYAGTDGVLYLEAVLVANLRFSSFNTDRASLCSYFYESNYYFNLFIYSSCCLFALLLEVVDLML